jgi:hypothetical protein
MNCRLCQQPKPLRNSHIISEFLHQDMYDPKHRFFGLTNDPAKRERLFQKGLREPLLCDDCEQQFSKYERYASGAFYGGEPLGRKREGDILMLAGVQYAPMKLFLLSLLWRMGVTSIPELAGLDLGAHEPKLREVLRAGQAPDFLFHPCLLTAVLHERQHVPDLIVPPGVAHVDGHAVWSFVAAGFVFSYFVSDRPVPSELHPAILKPDGTMWIKVGEMRDIDFLNRHALEIGAAMQQRNAKSAGEPGDKP